MATNHRLPLLNSHPTKKSSPTKAIYISLSLIALLGVISIISIYVINNPIDVSLHERLCQTAHDPHACKNMVSDVASSHDSKLPSDVDVLLRVLQKSVSNVGETVDLGKNVGSRINDQRQRAAVADCLELMDLSMDRLVDSMMSLGSVTSSKSHADVHTWLSSVLANHVTCMDELKGAAKSIMEVKLNDLISRSRTSLAIIVAISPLKDEIATPLKGNFPSWVTSNDRRLLQGSALTITSNVVVAKDGSGKYTTVQAAVDAAPINSQSRYVIYVKQGTYKENVIIGKTKKNLMLVGDGMGATVITGSLNNVDGSTTFNSATVAAVGDGFIAQDIWFQNTAGAAKHQAVALRVGADQSVINRCRIDAYQDTLYTHSLRQFYRDCDILGTVDFIFGDAAVVFQNCQIEARKPLASQKNTVTAQGRTDPNENTGTSIQGCTIKATSDLQPLIGSIPSYLGRPWKLYSRTVVMETSIDSLIDPAGWLPWDGTFALDTLYYGEYMNKGPGAGTGKRVNWSGFHVITDAAVANKFTVAQLIQGGSWLQSTGVTYTEGL